MISSVPMARVCFVTPCLMSWFGLPPSIIQVTTVPLSSFTSRWNHEWGLIISHFVRIPRSLNGLSMSNSAENAWWAITGAAASSRPRPTPTTTRLIRIGSPSLFRGFLFRGFLGGSLLLCPSAREGVVQAIIPFVTGVLKYRAYRFLPGYLCGPGSCPRRRIFDPELIADRVLGHAREALGQTHVLARALERELVREIRRFDNQRLALPMTAVAPRPLADVWRQVRTSVERNDADVVEHLGENHHVSGRVHDLVGVVVGPGKHWRPVAVHQDTTRTERLVLYGIVGATPALSRCCALGGSPLAFRGQGRKSSVRRVDDQRRPQVQGHPSLAPVQPKLRKVIMHIGHRAGFRLLRLLRGRAFGQCERFLASEELLGDVLRSLQRCIRGIRPDALQIRLTVQGAGRDVGLRRVSTRSRAGRSGLTGNGACRQPRHRGGNDETAHQNEKSMIHLESPIHPVICRQSSCAGARTSILRRTRRT